MKALAIYVALAALTMIVFAVWPGLDLAVAHFFYDRGGFIGQGALARFGRDVFRVTPFVLLALYAGLWLAKRNGVSLRWAPSGRGIIFLIATIAIGPGLIVNLGLKDHWHRPRPVQTQDFKGPDSFRPWYKDNGACKKNCSFVSGEASTGFWMVAPASLLPPPWRGPATIAAFLFGIGSSLLRMAFGGHYLSDVLLGGLVSLIVIEITRKIVWPRGEVYPSRDQEAPTRMGEQEMSETGRLRSACAVIVMGVSGSGKSTVGALLANRLGWEMIEGDRLHPAANIEKMRRGIPLDDADRAPWLDRIGEQLRAWAAEGRSGLVTCSALKRAYRERIRAARPDVRFVYLKGSKALIQGRVSGRHHEYMPASLLTSQFEALEEPSPGEPVIVVDVNDPPEAEAQKIIDALGIDGSLTDPASGKDR